MVFLFLNIELPGFIQMILFNKKILLLGYGAVGRCTLPLIFRHLDVPFSKVTVVDNEDRRADLKDWTLKGVKFIQKKISNRNLEKFLSSLVLKGDLIISVAWNIDTVDLVRWCFRNQVLCVNSSFEEWFPNARVNDFIEKTFYFKKFRANQKIYKWKSDRTTAVLEHGANPGLVSHFVKRGLLDITDKLLKDNLLPKEKFAKIDSLISAGNFAGLSLELDIKAIHCSEKDSQQQTFPKARDEFVGTWSIESFVEEAVSAAEIGWGTHEKELPKKIIKPRMGLKNQVVIRQFGLNTFVRSWVPHEEIIGMIIKHEETYTISASLTLKKNNKIIYRPTVVYAYLPCPDTMASLDDFRLNKYKLHKKKRVMFDEIIHGSDTMGALLMGHKYNSWWTGSILTIDETRRLVPNQNATTLQVAIGVISGAVWAIENPNKGAFYPDDLPYEYILNIAKPYLGEFISIQSDWRPGYSGNYNGNPDEIWSFKNFLLN
jgi:homospermidine synthase